MNTNSNRNAIRTKTRKMRNKAAEIVGGAEQAAGAVVKKTVTGAVSLRSRGAAYLRSHPWQAALAAMAIGFFAGFRARR